MFQIRTDLALETREKFDEDHIEVKGVRVDEERISPEIMITRVFIDTENGAKAMKKQKGTYITIEASDMMEEDEDYHREVSGQLAKVIETMLPGKKEELKILVVGLGNREVTPDALGPYVVDNMMITRHIIKEYGQYAFGNKATSQISGIVPGVMAQTGMESGEIVRGVIEETKPDIVIVVDALAARSVKRLNRTIQITDTGINPGSGVGNHRHAINKESMGIPVIAIGIPTVVDAATIVSDTMSDLIGAMRESAQLESVGNGLAGLDEIEKHELARELLSPHLNAMFVTPKDIDETVRRISYTISEALNMLFAASAT